MSASILILDDEPDIRELLEVTLHRMALSTRSAGTLTEAIAILQTQKFDLCLTDMRLPDGDGFNLIDYIRANLPTLPVAVITAHGNTEMAIRALKAGAFDFVSKPVNLNKLRDLVTSALSLTRDNSFLSSAQSNAQNITGQSLAAIKLREQISSLARTQAPVFITGESGSGKELAARAIHAQSSRRNGPFVAVNCGAIPAELMESELFGHLKGSFTSADKDKKGLFQTAEGGSLFLDEVADLPLSMQVKLLRVIQEKSVRPVGSHEEVPTNIRVISASHKNLQREIELNNFRQDLYYRINVIELLVPPLRERTEDIEELSRHILRKIAKENRMETPSLTPQALKALIAYHFPGNIRELENILQRAAALSANRMIAPEDLDIPGVSSYKNDANPTGAKRNIMTATQIEFSEDFSLARYLEDIERTNITAALQQTRWNKTAAAKKLGMSFRSLRYRLKKLGLE
ncbi:MAG: sigma-54 dependent transcriptional regulator [Pseudomonadales bacterium]|nr:sigma-54 dependent transcriptional regulator [Pseudomonadales bacterium]